MCNDKLQKIENEYRSAKVKKNIFDCLLGLGLISLAIVIVIEEQLTDSLTIFLSVLSMVMIIYGCNYSPRSRLDKLKQQRNILKKSLEVSHKK